MSFFWVHGEWIVARDKQIAWTAKRFSDDLFVPRYNSFPMNPEKKYSFLIFTMLPTKTLSKILRESLLIQNSHSNGHLTSFDVLIFVHVIRSDCRTICWLYLSRVQRRKYDTIVNIARCTMFLGKNVRDKPYYCNLLHVCLSMPGWRLNSYFRYLCHTFRTWTHIGKCFQTIY